MEKTNLVEILKHCESGMELNCTMFENTYFDCVDVENNLILCYSINDNIKTGLTFSKYGTYSTIKQSKCVIFPKGKTTWEGFIPPCEFKNGDIVAFDTEKGTQLFIFKEYIYYRDCVKCHMMLDYDGETNFMTGNYYVERFATEEEKAKLFKAIKDNGYEWDNETKEIYKPFKDGDIISFGNGVICIYNKSYNCFAGNSVCGIFKTMTNEWFFKPEPCDINDKLFKLASEEEKQLLFQHLEKNGYKYNEKTNTLEKIVLPIFKVGDEIIAKDGLTKPLKIISVSDFYFFEGENGKIPFMAISDQDKYILCQKKFDFNSLKPFDKVLTKFGNGKWEINFFQKYRESHRYPFECLNNNRFDRCVPYNGNEHLLDTTDDCDEYYKIWEMM